MKIMKWISTVILSSAALLGCLQQPTEPNVFDADRIKLNNNEEDLNRRVTYFEDKDVPIFELDSGKILTHISGGREFTLKLRAEIEPPKSGAFDLHANHVTLNGHYAYVSYSTQYNQFSGGVEIYDISDRRRPRIISQAMLPDTDVSIAVASDGKLYLGEATDSDHDSRFDSPACLEVIELQNGVLTGSSRRIDLPSHNANDVRIFDNSVFVTSGTTNGTLSILDQNSLNISEQIKIEGVKAIGRNENYIIAMEGTGAKLHLFDRQSHIFLKSIELGCTNFFQAKAEIDIVGDLAYLSAYECGMKVVDLNSATVVGGIPAVMGGICNGVSVSGDYIFLANGSNGLLVAEITETGFDLIGRAIFYGSTNFVAIQGNQIFVANGKGGLVYIEVVRK